MESEHGRIPDFTVNLFCDSWWASQLMSPQKETGLLMQTWDKLIVLWELEQTTLEHNPQQSQEFACFKEFPGSLREGINRTSQA